MLEKWDIPYACIGEVLSEEVVSVKGLKGESPEVSIDLSKEFESEELYLEKISLTSTFVKHDFIEDS